MGIATYANVDASTAMGSYTVANAYNSLVIGTFNVGLPNSVFEIWIGDDCWGDPPCGPKNAMTVLNDWKVGIGTDTPADRLEVNGTIKATTSVKIGINLTNIVINDYCANEWEIIYVKYSDTNTHFYGCVYNQFALGTVRRPLDS